MPFNNPANQLIQMLNLPINLDSKRVTMTPDVTCHNSPNHSFRKSADKDISLVSLVRVKEEEGEYSEDVQFKGNHQIIINNVSSDEDREFSRSPGLKPMITQRSKESSTNSEQVTQDFQIAARSKLSSSRKNSINFRSPNIDTRQNSRQSSTDSFKKEKGSKKMIKGYFHSRKNSIKGLEERKKNYYLSEKQIYPAKLKLQNMNKPTPKKQKIRSGEISRSVNVSFKREKNLNLKRAEQKGKIDSGAGSKGDKGNLKLTANPKMPLVLQKLILQNKIREGYKLNSEGSATTLDFYQFHSLLGEGSFGKVYKAVSVLTEVEVAIKCFDKAKIRGESAKHKVFQEVRILKMLEHPNVIRLLEVFENRKFIFFVMEYAEEGDILKLLKKRGPLDESISKYFVAEIIKGLYYCHQNSVLHRDIKLDNVLLAKNFMPKICDFGVSRILKKGEMLTEQCGTPAYIAPEVIRGNGYSGYQADIWNLAILLFAMVTGTVPFKSDTINELHELILKGKFTFPSNCDLSPELKDLLCKMLILNPKERIDLEGMMNHPWINKTFNLSYFDRRTKDGFDNKNALIKKVRSFGFPDKEVKKTLDQQILNHIHACYHLLREN